MNRESRQSDALVFFGATGDLAHKKIYPALQALTRGGELDMPVIGVARAGWTVDTLREHVRDSLDKGEGGIDEAAFARLAANLRYIDGDYKDPATFEQLKRQLDADGASQPLHYLAIPPALFATVRAELTEAFGGVTAYQRAPATGLWEDGDEAVQRDDLVLFEVMVESLDRGWWRDYRRELERLFRQDEIVVRAQNYEAL